MGDNQYSKPKEDKFDRDIRKQTIGNTFEIWFKVNNLKDEEIPDAIVEIISRCGVILRNNATKVTVT